MSDGLKLGVNIDHIATLRQARYRTMPEAGNVEPSVVEAARICEEAGADSITVHLRVDRRHIQDADVFALREKVATKLNLEMGNTAEILEIALEVKPDYVCLVPENRQEVTTEGGLDVAGQVGALKATVERLQGIGTEVSLFIDPEAAQIEASAAVGGDMVELHTGAFANAFAAGEGEEELGSLIEGAKQAREVGLQVNAGHGITVGNMGRLCEVPNLVELNIGHHLVSRAMAVGLGEAIREMREAMSQYSS
ncbi:MAG: pyridoxine 5'-phosphate synthase [Verrucomicrobiota bacterium]